MVVRFFACLALLLSVALLAVAGNVLFSPMETLGFVLTVIALVSIALYADSVERKMRRTQRVAVRRG